MLDPALQFDRCSFALVKFNSSVVPGSLLLEPLLLLVEFVLLLFADDDDVAELFALFVSRFVDDVQFVTVELKFVDAESLPEFSRPSELVRLEVKLFV